MAKLTAPLLSMGASGQIGKTMVVSSWKGVKYARQHVVPANPRTTAQQANRTRFALLGAMFKLAPSVVLEPWDAFVKGRPFTSQNKFVGENNRLLVGETSLLNMQMSPGARGGIPPSAVVGAATANPGEVDVTITVPSQLPTDWTIVNCAAAAVLDQDPVGIFSGQFVADVDATAPYVVTLDGFPATSDLIVFGWIKYLRPDGLNAYSVSLSDAVTTA